MAPSTVSGRRLLLLAPFSPRLDAHHGGSRAIAQLVAALAERHRVAVLYLRGPGEPGIDEAIRSRCELVREVGHTHPAGVQRRLRQARVGLDLVRGTPLWVSWWTVPAYAEQLREIAAAWQPEVVQLEFHIMGQYLHALDGCPAARILVEHDPGIGATGALARGLGPRRLLAALDRRAWRRYESDVIREVDAVVTFTERDRITVAAIAGITPVVRIPLGAVLPDRPLSPEGLEPATLLFIGSFSHVPNADAAERLLGGILPRLRTRHPEVRLMLVGANPPPRLYRLAGADVVEITGVVPDVTPFLDRASVVVMPLRVGGGMRVKALEALAAGKAIVASPLAVEGLDVGHDRECLLAETDSEFVERAAHLLEHPQERRRLGRAARAWAVEHLGWDRVAHAYERLYRNVLETRCRTR